MSEAEDTTTQNQSPDEFVASQTKPASQEGAVNADVPAAEESPVAVEVNRTTEKAQVAPARDPEADTVAVHETSVRADVVITDPNHPLAVQVPAEGIGDSSTPIGRAWGGDEPKHIEDVFAAASAEQD